MSRALHRFAALTAACAFLLLFAGAMVTSTGSGLAVPDWPLSYGQVLPPMIGGIFFEHGHRMVAGAVGLMVLALAGWIWAGERAAAPRRLAAAAAAGILVQAALGGLTVLYGLPRQVSIAHALLGQTVFCLILSIAQTTSPWWERARPVLPAGFWRPGAFLVGACFLQVALGAALRHTGSGLAWHMGGAGAVVAALGMLSFRTFLKAGSEAALTGPVLAAISLLPLQLLLGLAAALDRSRVLEARAAIPSAHLALGAALLGAALLWTLRARRLSPS